MNVKLDKNINKVSNKYHISNAIELFNPRNLSNTFLVIYNIIKTEIKHKKKSLINLSGRFHFKHLYQNFENNYKKLLEYNKIYDIIYIKENDFIISNSSLNRNCDQQEEEILKTKIKNIFKIIYFSMEMLHSLKNIDYIFSREILGELNYLIETINSCIKQIIIMVRFDIRGIADFAAKKHFEFAFDELFSRVYNLRF